MGWGFGTSGVGILDIRIEENWNIRRGEAGLISTNHADWHGGLFPGIVWTASDIVGIKVPSMFFLL